MRPAHSYHIVLTVAFTARLQRHVGHACAPVSGLVVRGNGRTLRGVVSVHIVLVVTVGVAPIWLGVGAGRRLGFNVSEEARVRVRVRVRVMP